MSFFIFLLMADQSPPLSSQVSNQSAPPLPEGQVAQPSVQAEGVLDVQGDVATHVEDQLVAQYQSEAQSMAQAMKVPSVASDERLWAALSYIPMVALISLMVKPKSSFVHLHGRQGLLLFVIVLLWLFLSFFLYVILPVEVVIFFWSLLQLGLFLVGVYSFYQALIGHWWKIPFLGALAELIPVEFFAKVASEAITGQQVSNDDR